MVKKNRSIKNNKPKINKTKKNKILKNKIVGEIRFYDNQMDIINQFNRSKKYVSAIQVSNNDNVEVLNGNYNYSLYTDIFLKLHPNNKYALYLKNNNYKETGSNIGFTYSDIDDLIEWSKRRDIVNKVVIFDWDGTLSVTEGIVIASTNEVEEEHKTYGITSFDIAMYYAGTMNRLNELKRMFNILHKKNVKVYILTNNPIATCNWTKYQKYGIGPQSRINFFKVVKEFIPQIKEDNILCGFDTNGFKPDTFFNNNYLRNLYYEIQKSHITKKF
jgi:hypothetical protein